MSNSSCPENSNKHTDNLPDDGTFQISYSNLMLNHMNNPRPEEESSFKETVVESNSGEENVSGTSSHRRADENENVSESDNNKFSQPPNNSD